MTQSTDTSLGANPAGLTPAQIATLDAAAVALDLNVNQQLAAEVRAIARPAASGKVCTCPSGDRSLRWPCPRHPPEKQGYKLVPVEPTDEMLAAGALAHHESKCHDFEGPVSDAWAAMLNAAPPTQPAPADEPVDLQRVWDLVETIASETVRQNDPTVSFDGKIAATRRRNRVSAELRILLDAALKQRPAAPLATDAGASLDGHTFDLSKMPVGFTVTKTGPLEYTTTQPLNEPLAAHPAAVEVQRPARGEPLTAGELCEPKNGGGWRVEWWNESARLLLPDGKKLRSFDSYGNGTLVFRIEAAGTVAHARGKDRQR